jgi:DNA-binding MarR family transcriptional regulator
VALIDGLEKRGLAARTPDPTDRRCHALQLTAEGERVLAQCNAAAEAVDRRLDAKLGPDGRRQLLAMLWALATE